MGVQTRDKLAGLVLLILAAFPISLRLARMLYKVMRSCLT